MGKSAGAIVILLGLCFISPEIFCQEIQTSTIPGVLLRPEKGENPRYPSDLVIGELGQGEASYESYRFARELLAALLAGAGDAPVLTGINPAMTKELLETIKSIEPRSCRLGSGRNETDGSVSFLLRFFGPGESITGELFIRQAKKAAKEETEEKETDKVKEMDKAKEEKWVLDDLILEEKRALSEIKDSYRYDFSPYERFY